MSFQVEIELVCDGVPDFGCTGSTPFFASSVRKARQWAREAGWLVSAPGGKDYCPAHRPKGTSGVSR